MNLKTEELLIHNKNMDIKLTFTKRLAGKFKI